MRQICTLLFASFLMVSVSASATKNWKQKCDNPDFLHRSIKLVTDVIVHDIYSPPVASRIYAYITIAAYEASLPCDPRYLSLAGQLHDLKPTPSPDPRKEYSYALASVHAVLLLGKSFIISEKAIEDFHRRL